METIPPAPSLVTTPAPAVPTPAQVYSPQNVAATFTAPATAQNLADPYGLYDQFMKSPEIISAQQQVSETQKAINASQQALRTTTTALENQNEQAMGGTGASINLIGKQVGRARDLTSNELAALGENLNAQNAYLSSLQTDASNKYNIAQNERAQLQDLIRATNGKAKITYSDSYESALKKAAKYEEQVKKEEEKKAYKDSLKEQIRSLGGSTKGLSTKELEKKLKKKIKESGSDDAEMKQLELALKRKELAKPYYAPTGADGDDKLVKAFESDVERLQTQMDKENGGIDWNYSWNYINNKYPGFSPQEIDEVLGLNYRTKFES